MAPKSEVPLAKSMSKIDWLFFRGLIREQGHWGDFPQKFEAALPTVRVTCLDLPGNGDEYQTQTPSQIRDIMEFLREKAFNGKKPKSPVFMLALSLGGMVVWEWIQRYPDEVRGAVLINTSLRGVSPFYRRLSPGSYHEILRILVDRDPHTQEERILKLTTNRILPNEGLVHRWTDIRESRPVSITNAMRQIVAAVLYQPPHTKPKAPVLLLNSLGDHLVHPDCSWDLHHRWGLSLKRHAWAGHDLPLEDPQWVVDAVRDWIEELAASPENQEAIL